MEEHHSILYGPVNGLLKKILGEPPVGKLSPGQAAFFFPDGKEAWIPDAAIMTLLLLAIFAIVFPLLARRYSKEKPSKTQSFMEMLVAGLPSYGTTNKNPDFAAVARACGAYGVRVEKPDEVVPIAPNVAITADEPGGRIAGEEQVVIAAGVHDLLGVFEIDLEFPTGRYYRRLP